MNLTVTGPGGSNSKLRMNYIAVDCTAGHSCCELHRYSDDRRLTTISSVQ